MACTNCTSQEFQGWQTTKAQNEARLDEIDVEIQALETERGQLNTQNAQLDILIQQCQIDGGPP